MGSPLSLAPLCTITMGSMCDTTEGLLQIAKVFSDSDDPITKQLAELFARQQLVSIMMGPNNQFNQDLKRQTKEKLVKIVHGINIRNASRDEMVAATVEDLTAYIKLKLMKRLCDPYKYGIPENGKQLCELVAQKLRSKNYFVWYTEENGETYLVVSMYGEQKESAAPAETQNPDGEVKSETRETREAAPITDADIFVDGKKPVLVQNTNTPGSLNVVLTQGVANPHEYESDMTSSDDDSSEDESSDEE